MGTLARGRAELPNCSMDATAHKGRTERPPFEGLGIQAAVARRGLALNSHKAAGRLRHIKCFLFEINHRTSSRKLGLGTVVAVNGHLDSPSSWPPWAPVIERFYRTQATPLPLN